jgi:SAM-dependent methyltransferase
MRQEWQSNFEAYMTPMTKEFFRGKLVLDAGCGMGRHMFHAAEGGARVVGVDFSRAVEAAHENTKHVERTAVVQADVMRLPFRPGTFDFVYCLGVLHHLPQPLEALRGLVDVLKDRGECRIYVYHQIARAPRWKHALFRLASLCRRVSTRLPHVVLLAACWPLSVAIWVGCVVPYRLVSRCAPNASWTGSWLFRQYAPYSFMVLVNDQFDRFSAPIERRYTRDEVEELMGAAELRSIVVREDFGWIGHGLKCDGVSSPSPAEAEAPRVV